MMYTVVYSAHEGIQKSVTMGPPDLFSCQKEEEAFHLVLLRSNYEKALSSIPFIFCGQWSEKKDKRTFRVYVRMTNCSEVGASFQYCDKNDVQTEAISNILYISKCE